MRYVFQYGLIRRGFLPAERTVKPGILDLGTYSKSRIKKRKHNTKIVRYGFHHTHDTFIADYGHFRFNSMVASLVEGNVIVFFIYRIVDHPGADIPVLPVD